MHTTTGVVHGSITHVACDTDSGKSGLQRHRREGPHRDGRWQVSKEGAGKWEAGLQEVWVLSGSRDRELGGQGQSVAVASSDTWLESLLRRSKPSPLQPSQAPSDTGRAACPDSEATETLDPPSHAIFQVLPGCCAPHQRPNPAEWQRGQLLLWPQGGYKVCVPQSPSGVSARSRVYSDH